MYVSITFRWKHANEKQIRFRQETEVIYFSLLTGQIDIYLKNKNLLDLYQSGHRKHHSTNTAKFYIRNDILIMKDCHQATALVLNDLSAAFDLIDHEVPVNRLNKYFGFSENVSD